MEAVRAFRPPERLTVSEWADRYRVLDVTSAQPGKWKTSLTPYLRGVMDAFTDPEIEEMWFCKPTQVGGSEAQLNMLAFIIMQDTGPTMVVCPTKDFARYYSKNRLQPMINLCPELRERYLAMESEDFELHFVDMQLYITWADSPSALAGRPIRYLFFEEVNKFPRLSGKEASPIGLAYERTGTFPHNRKIVGSSTPTVRSGNVSQVKERANEVRRYFCPCPHCGHYEDLKFRANLKWPKGCSSDDALDLAWYECPKCKGRIGDGHKTIMVRNGEWRVTDKRGNGRRCVWFHLNTISSPWKRLGEIAQKFLASEPYPEELQNFVNSWLAEDWEVTRNRMDSDRVLERQTELEEGVIPEWAQLLIGSVDKQTDRFYWGIRAWGPMLTSQNIAHGCVSEWADIEGLMNRPWHKANGEEMIVNLCAIDSGNDTDEVYDFCYMNSDWAVPVKGASRPMLARYSISQIDKVTSKAHGMRLVIVDTAQYKSMIAGRVNRPNGRGSWMVYKDCDRDYAEQVTSEHCVPVMKGSQMIEVWEPKKTSAANHFLDVEVYNCAAADLMQVRYLAEEGPAESKESEGSKESKELAGSGWMEKKTGWM